MPDEHQRVMVIVAHPDDAEFTVAGTMARWAREGKEIILVLCTDGSRGSNDPSCSPEAMVAIRQAETAAAAAVLGVKEVVNLCYEDGTLQPTLALRRDLTRVIRRFKPDIVICSDPTRRYHGDGYLNHPDHRAAGDAALDAVFPSAGTRYIFPELLAEGLEPHNVKELYLHGADTPNTWIDITDTIDLKIEALKKHASQVGEYEELDTWIRDWATENGKAPGMTYAEAYKRMELG
jgi:LmbE family N-acetylglucosaminyl deacetylase